MHRMPARRSPGAHRSFETRGAKAKAPSSGTSAARQRGRNPRDEAGKRLGGGGVGGLLVWGVSCFLTPPPKKRKKEANGGGGGGGLLVKRGINKKAEPFFSGGKLPLISIGCAPDDHFLSPKVGS